MRRAAPAEVPAPGFDSLAWHATELPATAADTTATDGRNFLHKPKALIVGGSIGGCCAALALGELGCPVSVFERAPGDLKTQGAGLVIQPDMADFLLRYKVVNSVEDICVKSAGRQYIDGSCRVIGGDSNPQLFSAWDVLHRAIKARVPPGVYHSSSTVASIVAPHSSSSTATSSSSPSAAASGGPVSITLDSGEQHQGDLLVGCDGPGSLVRRHFLPDVHSEYQGYVAWRGFAYENELPQHVVDFIANKFTVYQMPRSHILAYTIPGADGATTPGSRRINWVWYWNTPEQVLPRLFLDKHGRQHLYSVPRGLLRPEVAEKRKQLARQVLPPILADLVGHTSDVFVQAIHDLLAPRLQLSDNCCLLGDAGCILRPHTAAGTTKAAVDAVALATCLQRHRFDLAPPLRQYSSSQLELAQYLVGVGRRIGTSSQFPERVDPTDAE